MKDLKFEEPILVTRPLLPPIEEYEEKLKEIWDNNWITNYGPIEREFQEKIKEFLDVENIEFFVNGHTSLEVAIKALDLTGQKFGYLTAIEKAPSKNGKTYWKC